MLQLARHLLTLDVPSLGVLLGKKKTTVESIMSADLVIGILFSRRGFQKQKSVWFWGMGDGPEPHLSTPD